MCLFILDNLNRFTSSSSFQISLFYPLNLSTFLFDFESQPNQSVTAAPVVTTTLKPLKDKFIITL